MDTGRSSNILGNLVDARTKALEVEQEDNADKWILKSLSTSITNLGEAITRREGLETFVSTNMFLFWAADDNSAVLEIKEEEQALKIAN